MRIKGSFAALLVGVVAAQPVSAQAFAPPVAANAFITFGGLDWAWASPCRAFEPSCSAFALVDGFRFASLSEWSARPDPSAFLDPSGNFAGGAGQMRCAAGWFAFGPNRLNCDYNDAVIGYVSSGPGVGGNGNDNDQFDETWVVRGEGLSPVPEPATLSLLATGLVGLAGLSRRRKA